MRGEIRNALVPKPLSADPVNWMCPSKKPLRANQDELSAVIERKKRR